MRKIAELDIHSLIYSSSKDTRKRKGMRDNGASKVSQPLNKQVQKCIQDKSRDAQARSVKDSSFKEKTQKKNIDFVFWCKRNSKRDKIPFNLNISIFCR